ncbi:MAG TPA: Stk1 family PASTA domain-containing Ser/Thr kinase [Pseudonocardiaceae bacterium]
MSTPRLLSNRYELSETLGYGGMSEVHRGRDVRLGRDVAVKVLRADLARDPQFQLRFRREAQNAAALNHPAIVAVYDTGETDSEYGPLPYIVMEFVDGRTLRDIIKTEGPLPPRRAMEIMADVCAALDFSHRHGIVHRDVKPANIMITKSGAVKVMDFGIARAVADGQVAVTQTAAVIGTAQYLSPEQARGETVDARSDVYAVGCVLFELLTGEPPFTGDSPVAVAYQHVREEPRAPSSVVSTVPPVLDAVVLKAMSKNPANRYQSAAEMRADLVRVLAGHRPAAPLVMPEAERTSMLESTAPTEAIRPRRTRVAPAHAEEDEDEEGTDPRRRKRIMVSLVALLCVGVLVLGAWLTSSLMSGGEKAEEKVNVPDVVGMTQAQARQRLIEDGFDVGFERVPSSKDDIDKVVATDPPPGTPLPKRAKVIIKVGTGPETVTVPDLTGKTPEEAQETLKQVELEMSANRSEEETEDENMVGKVVRTEPPAGETVPKGERVQIVVGKAPEKVLVPQVTDVSYEQAKSILEAAGLKVKRKDVDSDKDEGVVVAQNPAANTKVKKGSEVELQVSNGSQKDQIELPDLRDLTPQQAEKRLQQLGWTGELVIQRRGTGDFGEHNKILEQDPAPGKRIGKDQNIRLLVGQYDPTGGDTEPTTTRPRFGG